MQEKIRIPSTTGDTLAGVIHHPDAGTPLAWALFAHCFTCTKNIRAAVDIAEFAGWPILITSGSLVLAVGFAAAVGILFVFFPALKASRLDPIEALRHE